jgi:hypothetical protein
MSSYERPRSQVSQACVGEVVVPVVSHLQPCTTEDLAHRDVFDLELETSESREILDGPVAKNPGTDGQHFPHKRLLKGGHLLGVDRSSGGELDPGIWLLVVCVLGRNERGMVVMRTMELRSLQCAVRSILVEWEEFRCCASKEGVSFQPKPEQVN